MLDRSRITTKQHWNVIVTRLEGSPEAQRPRHLFVYLEGGVDRRCIC
jgi:hypothetical protein